SVDEFSRASISAVRPIVSSAGGETIRRSGNTVSSPKSASSIPSVSQPTRKYSTDFGGKTFGPRSETRIPGSDHSASGKATDREARKRTTTRAQRPIAMTGLRRVGNARSGPIRAAPSRLMRARSLIDVLQRPATFGAGRVVGLVDHLRAEHD